MNALQNAQFLHDNAEPADDTGREEALQRWIEDNAEQLVYGVDIKIVDRGWHVTTVKYWDFLLRVQEHLTSRLDQDDELDLAQTIVRLQLGRAPSCAHRRLLGPTDHPISELHRIAEEMLAPHAEMGLQADIDEAAL